MLVDTVMGQNTGLPFGCARPMASHRGEYKGPASAGFPEIDCCPDNRSNIRDAAAACADGDTRARRDVGGHAALFQLGANRAGHIIQRSMRKILAYGNKDRHISWYSHG